MKHSTRPSVTMGLNFSLCLWAELITGTKKKHCICFLNTHTGCSELQSAFCGNLNVALQHLFNIQQEDSLHSAVGKLLVFTVDIIVSVYSCSMIFISMVNLSTSIFCWAWGRFGSVTRHIPGLGLANEGSVCMCVEHTERQDLMSVCALDNQTQ